MDQNSTVYQRIVCIMDQNSTVYVKTPAVKPCIVYIIDLPDSVGSKVPGAERFVGSPH